VTIKNGASATRSLPRRGSRGFKGSFNRTSATPAKSGAGASHVPAATASAKPANAERERRLRATGRLSRRPRVGRVELGEPCVVAPDVRVFGIEIERFLVLGQGSRVLARGLQRHGEVVVRARVAGLSRDRLLESERGLSPESLARDIGSECDLGGGGIGVGIGGATGGGQDEKRCENGPTVPQHIALRGGGYYRKAFRPGKISDPADFFRHEGMLRTMSREAIRRRAALSWVRGRELSPQRLWPLLREDGGLEALLSASEGE